MKYRISDYVINIWVTSIIGSPILFILEGLITDKTMHWSDFRLLPIFILFGAAYSVPSLGIFYLISRLIIPRMHRILLLKACLTMAAILLTYFPFLIINNYHPIVNVDAVSWPLFITYGSIIIIGIWLYKIKQTFADGK